MATWNVQGLRTKQNEVFEQLELMKVDVGVLSETKKKGHGNENVANYIHFYSGVDKEKRAKAGVSIVVHKRFKSFIQSWENTSERIMQIHIELLGYDTVIAAVYAPNDDAADSVKDAFEMELTTTLSKINPKKEVIIMGDLNSRVGRMTSGTIVGKHGEEVLNDNGERLIQMCERFSLKIMNGFFCHKDIHKYTWTQNTRQLRSIIDYIILKQKTNIKTQDVKVMRGAECGSDHYMVKGTFFFKYKPHSRNKRPEINENLEYICPKYNIESFQHDSVQFLYKLRLSAKLPIDMNQPPDAIYLALKTKLHEAAREVLGEKPEYKTGANWWTEDLQEIILEKKTAYQRWLSTKDHDDWRNYRRHCYVVKKAVAKSKSRAWEAKCEKVDRCMGGTKVREAWKVIKSVRNNASEKSHLSPIDISSWRNYFHKLLSEERTAYTDIPFNNEIHRTPDLASISEDEVRRHIKNMKSEKSPGPGCVPIELHQRVQVLLRFHPFRSPARVTPRTSFV